MNVRIDELVREEHNLNKLKRRATCATLAYLLVCAVFFGCAKSCVIERRGDSERRIFLVPFLESTDKCIVSNLAWRDLRVGEFGDIFSGIFAPLAMAWFTLAVFMQSLELRMQRHEISNNTEVNKEQANSLAETSKIQKTAVFISLYEAANRSTENQAEKLFSIARSLNGMGDIDSIATASKLLESAENLLSQIYSGKKKQETIPDKVIFEARKQLTVLCARYSLIHMSAINAGIEEFYNSIHHISEYGRIERTGARVLEKLGGSVNFDGADQNV